MSAWEPIKEIANKVRSGQLTAEGQVEKALKIANETQEYDALITVISKRSIERAKHIDALIADGKDPGVLAGVPFIAKDNFLVFGADTTAGSAILKGFDAPYQATAIEKLEKAGAICVGKANLDAFAHGSSTENSDYIVTKNPHDKTRVPGGSSGGSAAAVALEIAPFALGTDTGGSIRLPAAYCGVVGMKPTYGLVSRSGVVAMASSTDVIGPITRTVADAAIVLEVMAGVDELDSTTIPRDAKPYDNNEEDLTGKKVGIIKEYMTDSLRPEVKELVLAQVEHLKKLGVEVVEVSLPSLEFALACYYIICPAEVSSNLSRYDGQRFGYTHKNAQSLDESYEQSRSHGFGAEAKRRIMIGTYVLSSGYYDAYYKKAQKLRTKMIHECALAFEGIDYMIGPTAPDIAFKIGHNTTDPLQMYLTDIMTVAANLIGIPSISIPAGKIDGMPVGIQLLAPQRADRQLLSLAAQLEGAQV